MGSQIRDLRFQRKTDPLRLPGTEQQNRRTVEQERVAGDVASADQMPEVVEAAGEEKLAAGELHHLADLFAVQGVIAVL